MTEEQSRAEAVRQLISKDLLFDRRQTADYLAISSFEREEVEVMIAESEEFVGQMKRILTRS